MAEPDIHLINPLTDHVGGSEQRTLTLYHLLCRSHGGRTQVWSPTQPHAAMAASMPVTRIDTAAGVFPRGGILVFVGVYFPFGDWLAAARPEQVAVIVNLLDHRALEMNLGTLRSAGLPKVKLAYTSKMLQKMMRPEGQVLYSLIDVEKFPGIRADHQHFTLGRLSRDKTFKHHHEDAVVYDDVLARGGAVRLMGATAMEPQPRWSRRLTHLEAGSESAAEFLSRLDCFFYRTSPGWLEVFGRVIHEAMCTGLPVLCHRSVGGSEHIEHGVNGLLFKSTHEALDCLDALRRDEPLRRRMGRAARESVLSLHRQQLPQQTLDFLLR